MFCQDNFSVSGILFGVSARESWTLWLNGSHKAIFSENDDVSSPQSGNNKLRYLDHPTNSDTCNFTNFIFCDTGTRIIVVMIIRKNN